MINQQVYICSLKRYYRYDSRQGGGVIMKKYQITLFFISFLSGISACAKTSDPGKETAALPVLAPESEL